MIDSRSIRRTDLGSLRQEVTTRGINLAVIGTYQRALNERVIIFKVKGITSFAHAVGGGGLTRMSPATIFSLKPEWVECHRVALNVARVMATYHSFELVMASI